MALEMASLARGSWVGQHQHLRVVFLCLYTLDISNNRNLVASVADS